MKRSLGKRVQKLKVTTCSNLKDIKNQNGRVGDLSQPYKSSSSPCLALSSILKSPIANHLHRSYSAIYYRDHNFHSHKVAPCQTLLKFERRSFSTAACSESQKGQAPTGFMQGLEAVCACPCPCPGNCCLPPPCNTPPKCLQYMTGYYYYPYGTWFCGPYHVATGPCGPCTGPVTAGGPCGPNGPCPGGPCGPPGLSPCACACGALGCCGVCGMGSQNMAPNMPNAFSSNAQFVPFGVQGMYPDAYAFNNIVQYSYNPHPSFSPYPPGSLPWAQPNMPDPNISSPNMPPPFFGPGVNVPIAPIPVNTEPCGPITPSSNPSAPSSPAPKSSVRINPAYMKEVRSGASPYGAKPRPMPTRPPMSTSPKSSVYFSKTYTGARPISTTRNPCSSNLTPKPLRQSPPSRYDAICALSRNNPFTKPRINTRTLLRLDTIQTCYYTTRSMRKYAHNAHLATGELKSSRKLQKEHRQERVSSLEQKVEEVDSKPLCYWCLLCDRSSCPCQHNGTSGLAQKILPMSNITSQGSQVQTACNPNVEHNKKKTHMHCEWF